MEYCGAGSVADIMRILDRTVGRRWGLLLGSRCGRHSVGGGAVVHKW